MSLGFPCQEAHDRGTGREALKRLLLRWHPDKAPQAAQAEATRVLRFILQERERPGGLAANADAKAKAINDLEFSRFHLYLINSRGKKCKKVYKSRC